MDKIKKLYEKFKSTCIYKWYKGLPVSALGLTAFLSIMFFLTLLFNYYWSGLGADATREWLLPPTRNKEEFIEYATLYIYLISFGATMFAGLAVFLVFNDWKEQHNKSHLAIEAKECIKTINQAIGILSFISSGIKRLDNDKKIEEQDKDFIEILDQFSKLSNNINETISKSSLFRNLSGDNYLFEIVNEYTKLLNDLILFVSDLKDMETDDFKRTMQIKLEDAAYFNGNIIREFRKYIILE